MGTGDSDDGSSLSSPTSAEAASALPDLLRQVRGSGMAAGYGASGGADQSTDADAPFLDQLA